MRQPQNPNKPEKLPGKLFLFATFFEARSVLDQGEFVKIQRNWFENAHVRLLITGIGEKNTVKMLSGQTIFPPQVFNFGICGGSSGLSAGSLLVPDLILHERELQKSNTDEISGKTVLITVSEPMENPLEWERKYPALREAAAWGADMEGSVLRDFFSFRQIPLKIIKIVSDSGNSDFRAHFHERREKILEQLKNVALSQLF